MKVIVAGGRDFDDYGMVHTVLYDLLLSHGNWVYPEPPEFVSGGADGADALGELFAKDWACKCTKFPADWDQYGKAAGVIRNQQMADYADMLVAFWDGKSKGTKNMIDCALRRGLEMHVYRYEISDTGKVIL